MLTGVFFYQGKATYQQNTKSCTYLFKRDRGKHLETSTWSNSEQLSLYFMAVVPYHSLSDVLIGWAVGDGDHFVPSIIITFAAAGVHREWGGGGIVTCQLRTFNNCKKVETEIGSEVSEAWRKKNQKILLRSFYCMVRSQNESWGCFFLTAFGNKGNSRVDL